MTSTPTSRTPHDSEEGGQPQRGLGLSAPQVAGSALAAVSAAVAASFFGVAGTIIGAAMASLFATVGSAVYAQTLRRSTDAVRRIRPSRDGSSVTVGDPGRLRRWRDALVDLPWKKVLLAAAVVLVVALGAITVFEKLTGSSVSQLTGGSDRSGTSVGSIFGGGSDKDRSDQQQSPGQDNQGPDDSGQDPGQDPSQEPTQDPSESPEPAETPTPSETPSPTAPTETPSAPATSPAG